MKVLAKYLGCVILFILALSLTAQEPTVQASGLKVSNITCSSALLEWTKGDGTHRIVIMKEVTDVDKDPIDDANYVPNSNFGAGQQLGTGNYVVFVGPINLVNIKNLKSNTKYFIKVFEFADNSGKPDYLLSSPATASFTTFGITLAFDTKTIDSCWYNNKYEFKNNSVSNFPTTNYIWEFGDGKTANAKDTSHRYSNGGKYTISLRVFPNYGCSDTAYTSLIVIPKPTIDIGVDDSAQCLTGNVFSFSNNTIYPNIFKLGLTRTWDFGDGTKDATARPKKTYLKADTYTVNNYVEMLYNNTPTGCFDTASIKLIVYPDPTGSVTVSDTIQCMGKNAVVFDNPAPNIISYNWNFGDGKTAAVKKVSHTYSSAGDYEVIHTAESAFGCISKDTVYVKARNRRISSFVGLSGPVCNSDIPIPLTPSDPTGKFYGKGVNGIQYVPNIIGKDTVSYVIDDLFCPDTTTVIIDIISSPNPSLGSDQNLCNQNLVTLTESISGLYTWSDGSNGTTLDVTSTGTYWLEVDDGTCKGRDSVYIYFGVPPILPAIADTFICKNSFIQFHFSNFDTKYLWNDGSTDSSRFITSGGLYSVTASNPCGTTNATFNINQLTDDCNVIMANAFTPNGDGINDTYSPVLLSDKIIVNRFVIFNNYGEILFDGKGDNIVWDGKYQNVKVPTNQNYYYLLYYTLPITDNTQKGQLTGSIFVLE